MRGALITRLDCLSIGVVSGLDARFGAARSISALLRHGNEGEDRLCRVLDTLRTQWNPQRIEIGRLTRETLAPLRARTRIDDCLKRWRWSAGGLLGAVMPRKDAS